MVNPALVRGNAKVPTGDGRVRCDGQQTSGETVHCAHYMRDPSQRTYNNVSQHASSSAGNTTHLITATRYADEV